jgi:squalene-hopene/tetraprenyl-beta-curcumene cyclase
MRKRSALACLLLPITLLSLASGNSVRAADEAQLGPMVGRGIAFLESAQAEDGSYSSHAGTGVTSLVTTALLQNGRTPQDPSIARSLAFLQRGVRDDGGIYQAGSLHRNYETCLAVFCFSAANRDGKYDALLKNAEAFLKKLQWDDEEGHDPSSTSHGGAGYGNHSRPDLSNTSFMIDALHSLGRDKDDPAIQRALLFISRCQNLETENNDTKFAAKNPDGGFYYTIAAGGSSQAGETPEGGLRSYGSMTYSGLKSMIYAGVGPKDPRVKAARKWIAKHYTLKENPNLGTSGHFYYLHTLAKAMDATGEDEIIDSSGVAHNWRKELIAELASRQLDDGSWINENQRWLEGDPNLVTGYVLLALSYVRDAN